MFYLTSNLTLDFEYEKKNEEKSFLVFILFCFSYVQKVFLFDSILCHMFKLQAEQRPATNAREVVGANEDAGAERKQKENHFLCILSFITEKY